MAIESTLILSPPTCRARSAKSWVVVITLSFDAACRLPEAVIASSAASALNLLIVFTTIPYLSGRCFAQSGLRKLSSCSERVRSVGAHGEHKLENQLVGGQSLSVPR